MNESRIVGSDKVDASFTQLGCPTSCTMRSRAKRLAVSTMNEVIE
jgi:hypothetical protein